MLVNPAHCEAPASIPILAGKPPIKGVPIADVRRNYACDKPFTDPRCIGGTPLNVNGALTGYSYSERD